MQDVMVSMTAFMSVSMCFRSACLRVLQHTTPLILKDQRQEFGTHAFCSPIAALLSSSTQIANHSKLHSLILCPNL